MRPLLYFLAETYYFPLILLLLSVIAAIIGFRHRHKFKYLRFFPWYALAAAMQILISFFCVSCKLPSYALIANSSLLCFMVVEFIIFYHLLSRILRIAYLRATIKVMQLIFLAVTSVTCLDFSFIECVPLLYNIINSLFLIIPCLFYFYEVFTSPPTVSLSSQPAFWIIIGFSFMVIGSLPFYFLEHFLYNNMMEVYGQLSAMTYVFYCLLFILISKAFLCKRAIAK